MGYQNNGNNISKKENINLLEISKDMKNKVKSLIKFLQNGSKEIEIIGEITEIEGNKNKRIIFDIDTIKWDSNKIEVYPYLENLLKEIKKGNKEKGIYPFSFELEIQSRFLENLSYKEGDFFKLKIKVSTTGKENLGYFHIDGSNFNTFLEDVLNIDRVTNRNKGIIIRYLDNYIIHKNELEETFEKLSYSIRNSLKLDYYQYNVGQANASKISIYTNKCKRTDLFFDLGIDIKKRRFNIGISDNNYIFISHWHVDHFRRLHKNINKFTNTKSYLIAPYDAHENPNLITVSALHLLLNFIYKFGENKLLLLSGSFKSYTDLIQLKKIQNNNNKNNNAIVLNIDIGSYNYCNEKYIKKCMKCIELVNFKKESSILFTGDASTSYYEDLLNYKNFFIFNIPHHGSRHSYETSRYCFESTFSFVSYGKNKYGHPNKDIINEVRKKSCILLKTKNFGQIINNNYYLDYLTTITSKFIKISIFLYHY